jgi:TPR repeat protein
MRLIRKFSVIILLSILAACTASDDPYVAYGIGNYEKAREKLEPLAEQGDAVAQTYLGTIYQMGLGVKKDYQKAYDLYKPAARSGYASAQYNLGLINYEGLEVKRDLSKAYGWFFLAAEQDHDKAQDRLRLMSTQITPNQIMQVKKWAAKQLD